MLWIPRYGPTANMAEEASIPTTVDAEIAAVASRSPNSAKNATQQGSGTILSIEHTSNNKTDKQNE
eukprot:SAG11_NODE_27491_length_332_cov_0.665236_1_plen_65_part_10